MSIPQSAIVDAFGRHMPSAEERAACQAAAERFVQQNLRFFADWLKEHFMEWPPDAAYDPDKREWYWRKKK